jgi:hypothetical protein
VAIPLKYGNVPSELDTESFVKMDPDATRRAKQNIEIHLAAFRESSKQRRLVLDWM